MSKYNIAVIRGDGIGPEIVPAGAAVLKAAAEKFGFELSYEQFPYGAAYYKQTGEFMPQGALDHLKEYDALYFGAVGLPDVDDTLPATAPRPESWPSKIFKLLPACPV